MVRQRGRPQCGRGSAEGGDDLYAIASFGGVRPDLPSTKAGQPPSSRQGIVCMRRTRVIRLRRACPQSVADRRRIRRPVLSPAPPRSAPPCLQRPPRAASLCSSPVVDEWPPPPIAVSLPGPVVRRAVKRHCTDARARCHYTTTGRHSAVLCSVPISEHRAKMKCFLIVVVALGLVAAQEKECEANQVLRGQQCVCSPGYFEAANEARCEDECEEVYYTLFTYGTCAAGLFDRLKEGEQAPVCNMRCAMRFRLYTTIFIIAVFAAAAATLFFTLPMCIATCGACLQAKKANRNTKKTVIGSQSFPDGHGGMEVVAAKQHQQQGPHMQTIAYNPYAYWPYYGRQM
uniref:Uncharacterized protein n=1 Tax=Plectus sambesii TaxID=2011161 RepID=A0A914UMH1_9BILA